MIKREDERNKTSPLWAAWPILLFVAVSWSLGLAALLSFAAGN